MATFLVVVKSNSAPLLVKRQERVRLLSRLRDHDRHRELLHAARAGYGGYLRERRGAQGLHPDHAGDQANLGFPVHWADLVAVVTAPPSYLRDFTRFAYLTGWS